MNSDLPEEAQPERQQELQQLHNQAIALLAGREHSRQELRNKLLRYSDDSALLEQVLEQLQADNLQSDARYADSFVRSRISRGQGPLRIRQELRQRGVEHSLIEQVLQDNEVDWAALALAQRRKRFGREPVSEPKAYARQSRFLAYRGFSHDQVRSALAASPDADD